MYLYLMKISTLLFLLGALALCAISSWNLFFSSRPEYHNLILLPASLVMIYSLFFSYFYNNNRSNLDKKREVQNNKRKQGNA